MYIDQKEYAKMLCCMADLVNQGKMYVDNLRIDVERDAVDLRTVTGITQRMATGRAMGTVTLTAKAHLNELREFQNGPEFEGQKYLSRDL